MRIETGELREVGARAHRRPDGGLAISSAAALTWQVLELRDDRCQGRMLRFSARITPLGAGTTRFCLHHFGDVDILLVDRAGNVDAADARYIHDLSILPLAGGGFTLSARFMCYAPGFSFGSAAARSVYQGDGGAQFLVEDLQIEVLGGPVFRGVLNAPTPARPPAAPGALRIAIPVHEPKALWLNHLLLSLDRSAARSGVAPCEIVLLLTSARDAPFFSRLCATLQLSFPVQAVYIREGLVAMGPAYAPVVQHLDAGASGTMAVLKKLTGLLMLAQQDDDDCLTLCFDADTLCTRWDADVLARVRQNYADGRFFGASVAPDSDFAKVNLASARCVHDGDAAPGPAAGLETYSWFFDAPVYGAADFRRFMDHAATRAGDMAAFLTSLPWYAFEHTMFSYFQLRQRGHVQNYDALSRNVPEKLSLAELHAIADRFGYLPLWATAAAFFEAAGRPADRPPPYFLSHFDRFGPWG